MYIILDVISGVTNHSWAIYHTKVTKLLQSEATKVRFFLKKEFLVGFFAGCTPFCSWQRQRPSCYERTTTPKTGRISVMPRSVATWGSHVWRSPRRAEPSSR